MSKIVFSKIYNYLTYNVEYAIKMASEIFPPKKYMHMET